MEKPVTNEELARIIAEGFKESSYESAAARDEIQKLDTKIDAVYTVVLDNQARITDLQQGKAHTLDLASLEHRIEVLENEIEQIKTTT